MFCEFRTNYSIRADCLMARRSSLPVLITFRPVLFNRQDACHFANDVNKFRTGRNDYFGIIL